jgi:hypothetical protein
VGVVFRASNARQLKCGFIQRRKKNVRVVELKEMFGGDGENVNKMKIILSKISYSMTLEKN